ncbi:hypothetical protein PILCRDRAFT_5026 [Piloderma croceum F 1598]|uniref:Uncharacterized protein n=1 Tax=Piloderma croceum (strain F 1598) TaxID=765440 RepID=A0A0C3FPC9_PILCF|nr:hypothetical protein PILCRDRAFT_5026 [Piloderma croceum F 1598]
MWFDPNLLLPPTSTPVLPLVFNSQLTRNHSVTPPPNASIPTSTPIPNKTSSNHSFASETHDTDSAKYRLAQETSDTPQCPNSEGAFKSISSAKNEVDMYNPFVTAATAFVVLIDTHANPDAQQDNLAPDILVYMPDNVPDADAKTDFSKMEFFMNSSLWKHLTHSWLTRGLSFASTSSPYLMRTICKIHPPGSQQGFTWSFDYIKQPHILAYFFWRYTDLNHSQRGYNTSILPASPVHLQHLQHVEKCLRDDNPAHHEFRILAVLNRDNPEVETPFIISFPPKYTIRSPFGRATRCWHSIWRRERSFF